MSMKMTGLGRGLDALIRETVSAGETGGESGQAPQVLRIDAIMPNANQPRKCFEKDTLAELAASITSQGVLQPLLVRPLDGEFTGKYEIVAGERRWRASQLAGLAEVPVIIRSLTEQETLMAALVENLQREDLNPIEEALGIEALKTEFGLSQEELATQLGKSRSAIANSLRLLGLPEAVRVAVTDGSISAGHARSLLAVTDEEDQLVLFKMIVDNNFSVRETEGFVSLWKKTGRFDEAPETVEQKPAKASSGRKQPSSERLLLVQRSLTDRLSAKVKVSGTEQKGKITIAFSHPEELNALLELFERL